MFGCQNDPSANTNGGTSTPTTVHGGQTTNKITKLQDIIDSSEEGSEINLSEHQTTITDYNATINKKLTLKGSGSVDIKDSKLTVTADGVLISNVSNANVITTSNLGKGSLKIANSSLNRLVLNGGGSNSIHLSGTTVTDATADYEGVRIVFDDMSSSIANLSASSFCKIDSEVTCDTAVVANLKINADSLVDLKAAIGKVAVQGANARLNLSEHFSSINTLDNMADNLLNTFKLITVEEVQLPTSIDTSTLTKINNKTSHSIIPSSDASSDNPWGAIEFNYEELLQAWKNNTENGYAGTDFWTNYQNLRILDKNNLDKITGIRSHGLQMCEWLTSVDIGENVNKIGKHIFLGCHNIRKVIVRATEPPVLEGKLFYAVGDDTSDVAIDTTLFSYENDNISANCIDLAIEFFRSQSADEKGDISEIGKTLDDCNAVLDQFKENEFLCAMLRQNGIDLSSIGHFLKSYKGLEKNMEKLIQLATVQEMDFDFNYLDPKFFLNKIVSSYKIIPVNLENIKIYVPDDSVNQYKQADYWKLYNIEPIGSL